MSTACRKNVVDESAILMDDMSYMSKSKGVSEERAESARAFIRAIVKNDFGGIVDGFAKTIDVSQSGLSQFLKGRTGIGLNVLEKVADYARTSIDEVVGRSVPAKAHDTADVEKTLATALETIRAARQSADGTPPARKQSPSGPPPGHPVSHPKVRQINSRSSRPPKV